MTRFQIIKNEKANSLPFFSFFTSVVSFAQEAEKNLTEKVWRINILNSGVEYEFPTGSFSVLSSGVGVGYGGSYPEITYNHSGWVYMVTPFIDVQHKWFYNLQKRKGRDKNLENNVGNFLSARLIARSEALFSNVTRKANEDLVVGPTWGIQRSFGAVHLLLDVGPVYYFDSAGNGGFYPIMLQLNVGFNL